MNHEWTELSNLVTTDGPSASLSWNKAPIWGLWPDFYYCQLQVCWFGALSLTRGRGCRLQLLLAFSNAVILGSESRWPRDHILLPLIRNFPYCRLLRLAGLRWRYSTPPPHRICCRKITCSLFITLGEPNGEHHLEQFVYIRCISIATQRVSIS
jgi:hypothetical protein